MKVILIALGVILLVFAANSRMAEKDLCIQSRFYKANVDALLLNRKTETGDAKHSANQPEDV